jgi:hypothetical protein
MFRHIADLKIADSLFEAKKEAANWLPLKSGSNQLDLFVDIPTECFW